MRKLDRDNLPHMASCLGHLVTKCCCTLGGRLAARWWGVPLGANCCFRGHTRFRRYPGSRITVGANCYFRSSANRTCIIQTLDEAATLQVGPGCGLSGTFIACAKKVVLGENVRCGDNELIWDTDWHTDDPRTGPDTPVVIGDNVWLGVNVMVLKGVTIGRDTLVGAGSLVVRSLPPGVIAMGVPARVIRQIDASSIEMLHNRA